MRTVIKNLPSDFPKEFTFRDLNEWYLAEQGSDANEYRTTAIGMTLEQEMWYRNLLRPEHILPAFVTYRGIPVIINAL